MQQPAIRALHLAYITLYTALVVFGAWMYEWPLLVTLFLLLAVPTASIMFVTRLPIVRVLGGVAVLASVLVILDAVARVSGAWYTVASPFTSPYLAVTLFAFFHTLYSIVLYEYLFDDSRVKAMRRNRMAILAALVASLAVTVLYIFGAVVVSFAFLWLLFALMCILVGLLVLLPTATAKQILLKAAAFSAVTLPLSLAFEVVLVGAGERIFAFTTEYALLVSLGSIAIPLEELVLLFLWPLLLVALYEGLLDDGH